MAGKQAVFDNDIDTGVKATEDALFHRFKKISTFLTCDDRT